MAPEREARPLGVEDSASVLDVAGEEAEALMADRVEAAARALTGDSGREPSEMDYKWARVALAAADEAAPPSPGDAVEAAQERAERAEAALRSMQERWSEKTAQSKQHVEQARVRADQAERAARELHEAHRLINRVLTTVEGDTIPRGDAPKLHARHLARDALSRHPQYDPGREGEFAYIASLYDDNFAILLGGWSTSLIRAARRCTTRAVRRARTAASTRWRRR